MSLLTVVLVIIVIGILLWLAEKYIPMDPTIKRILEAVVVIVLVLWILQVFGILQLITNVKVGKPGANLLTVSDPAPTPPLLMLTNILAEVVGLSVIIFAAVAQLKQWGLTGNALTGSAFGFGLAFGVLYKYATATPTDFAGWFWACVFGLVAGFIATGAYKGIESASGKNQPMDVVQAKKTFDVIAKSEANAAKPQPK